MRIASLILAPVLLLLLVLPADACGSSCGGGRRHRERGRLRGRHQQTCCVTVVVKCPTCGTAPSQTPGKATAPEKIAPPK
jgi:hypothetical protein